MKNKILWVLLSGVLGNEGASRVVVFFDALTHCLDYYDEAMEYREYLFLKTCFHCHECYSTDAKFCPNCGQKILSEEEQTALIEEEVSEAWENGAAVRDEIIAREEQAAWEEWRREREETIDPYGTRRHGYG